MNVTYIAFLRGINVSGSNLIKMESLKAGFRKAGFESVQTYIQSGNIIFEHPSASISELRELIHQILWNDFGLNVKILVKTSEELKLAIDQNPFLPEMAQHPDKLHLTFLERTPDKTLADSILPLERGLDQGVIVDDCIYLYCPEGYGRTVFNNTYFEKKLRMNATTRNWKTILKIRDLAFK